MSEVRISERPSGSSSEEVFSVPSPAGEPQVAEGKLSVPAGTRTETKRGNSPCSYSSQLKLNTNPAKDEMTLHLQSTERQQGPRSVGDVNRVLEARGFKQKTLKAKMLHMWINYC